MQAGWPSYHLLAYSPDSVRETDSQRCPDFLKVSQNPSAWHCLAGATLRPPGLALLSELLVSLDAGKGQTGMTFASKPPPVFGLEWSHRGQSRQPRGEGKDRGWKWHGPWPSWGPSLTLLGSPSMYSHCALLQGQPSMARGRLLTTGKVLPTCRFRETLEASGRNQPIVNGPVLGVGSQFWLDVSFW